MQSHTERSVGVIIHSKLHITNINIPPMQCCLSKGLLHDTAKWLVDSSSKYRTDNTGVITDLILSQEINCRHSQPLQDNVCLSGTGHLVTRWLQDCQSSKLQTIFFEREK